MFPDFPEPHIVLIALMQQVPSLAAFLTHVQSMYKRTEGTYGVLPHHDLPLKHLFALVASPEFRDELQVIAGVNVLLPDCLLAHVLYILTRGMGNPSFIGHLLSHCMRHIAAITPSVLIPYIQMVTSDGSSRDEFLPQVDTRIPDWWLEFTFPERLVYAIIGIQVGWTDHCGYQFCCDLSVSSRPPYTSHLSLGAFMRDPLAAALYSAVTQPDSLKDLIQHGRVNGLNAEESRQHVVPAVRDKVTEMFTTCPICITLLNAMLTKEWGHTMYLISRNGRDVCGMPSLLLHQQSAGFNSFVDGLRRADLIQHARATMQDMSSNRLIHLFRVDPSCDKDLMELLSVRSEVTCVDMYPTLLVTEVTFSNWLSPLLRHEITSMQRCSFPERTVVTLELLQEYLGFLQTQRGANLSAEQVITLAEAMHTEIGTKIKLEMGSVSESDTD